MRGEEREKERERARERAHARARARERRAEEGDGVEGGKGGERRCVEKSEIARLRWRVSSVLRRSSS